MKTSEVKACITDQGLFPDLACTLARTYDKVWYSPECKSAFQKINQGWIGKGLPGVTLTRSPFAVRHEADLFIFPDINYGDEQETLVEMGKRVWGSRSGEELELDRVFAKEKMADLGLPVGEYVVVKGVDSAREFLKVHQNWHVKISRWRGHRESWKSKSFAFSRWILADLEYQWGPFADKFEIILEKNLPSRIELAIDTYFAGGTFPDKALVGFEVKDMGYVCKVENYADIDESITRCDQALIPYLTEVGYCGNWACEVRIGEDRVPHPIDPCTRIGSPPGEYFQEGHTNLAEIIWEGAGGTMVQPKFVAKWGCEIMLHCSWSEKHWQSLIFPEEYRKFIKLRNCVKVDGEYHIIPQDNGCTEVGAVLGWGANMEEAFSRAREVAESIEGYTLEIPKDSLDQANKYIEEAHSFGLKVLS